MLKRKRTYKKGNWFVENLGQIVLTAIGIGIGIYFLWAYVLHGGGDSVKNLQQCGSLTGNKGECKETCDKSIELELPNIGCNGVANKCCVLKDENMNDVILPSGYGHSDLYDFRINSIAIAGGEPSILAAGCKADGRSLSSIKCPAGNGVTIPITIYTSNSGREIVTVKADPVIVINDNGDSVKEHKYPGKSIDIQINNGQELTTNVVITSENAKPNSYWEIYPYALCDIQPCRDADTSSRGIYRKDASNSQTLTIKFVDSSQI